MGEQSNAYRILLRYDRKSRHRRIKKQRRYERLAATSQFRVRRRPGSPAVPRGSARPGHPRGWVQLVPQTGGGAPPAHALPSVEPPPAAPGVGGGSPPRGGGFLRNQACRSRRTNGVGPPYYRGAPSLARDNCAQNPCGNFSGTSSLKFRGTKGSIGHTFMVCIHTENQNQGDFCPFTLLEISVLHESPLGHLRYGLTDVPPQPNSPPDNVFSPARPAKDLNARRWALAQRRFTE